jgi:orotidine-5'-phosphate decarboxylase
MDLGYDVFVDLKLFDIPTTVGKASRVLGALGARYLTLHARGEPEMVQAGVEGLLEGAERAGLPEPCALAVTVLTSDATAPPHVFPQRVEMAVACGCGGIVCAAGDLARAREIAPQLRRVVPGLRLEGADVHDQARAATPRAALEGGADLLVIGRMVTEADDPTAAAAVLDADLSTVPQAAR